MRQKEKSVLDLKSFIVENFECIQIHLQIQIIYRHGGGFKRGWKGNRSRVHIQLDLYMWGKVPGKHSWKHEGIWHRFSKQTNQKFTLILISSGIKAIYGHLVLLLDWLPWLAVIFFCSVPPLNPNIQVHSFVRLIYQSTCAVFNSFAVFTITCWIIPLILPLNPEQGSPPSLPLTSNSLTAIRPPLLACVPSGAHQSSHVKRRGDKKQTQMLKRWTAEAEVGGWRERKEEK